MDIPHSDTFNLIIVNSSRIRFENFPWSKTQVHQSIFNSNNMTNTRSTFQTSHCNTFTSNSALYYKASTTFLIFSGFRNVVNLYIRHDNETLILYASQNKPYLNTLNIPYCFSTIVVHLIHTLPIILT